MTERDLNHHAETSETDIPEIISYYPPDYGMEVATIEDRKGLALYTAGQSASRIPPEIMALLQENIDAEVDDPYRHVLSWRAATRRARSQDEALIGVKRKADTYLDDLAEPFSIDPPEDQWVTVEVQDTDRQPQSVRVPFTQSEFEAIQEAQAARMEIAAVAGRISGVERTYIGASLRFPDAIIGEGLTFGLQDRAAAVRGILRSARAAEDALRVPMTSRISQNASSDPLLMRLNHLPRKLTAHTAAA